MYLLSRRIKKRGYVEDKNIIRQKIELINKILQNNYKKMEELIKQDRLFYYAKR